MAFFFDKNSNHYFGVFYSASKNGEIDGSFHEMSAESAILFARMYKFFALFLVSIFFIELFVIFLSSQEVISWGESAIVAFIVIETFSVLPLAFFVIRKKRVKIEDKIMSLEKTKSIFVYIFVIALLIDYAMTLIWIRLSIQDAKTHYLWMLIFFVIISSASLRLRSLLISKS